MPVQQRKVFFSEEKKQKTFASLSRCSPATYAKRIKVFWFFFSKKNILAFCLLLAAGYGHARAAPLHLAAALSLTGPGDFYGLPARDGIRLAVEEANAESGEARIELDVADDHSEPEQAVALARKLGADDALAVIGPPLTVTALRAGPVYAQAGLVAIVPTAHGDDVPAPASVFQPIFNNGRMGAALADYLFHVLGGRRAIMLYRDDGYGRPLAAGFRREAVRLGLTARATAFTTEAERNEAGRLAAADPDHPAIAIGSLSADAVPLLMALRRGGVRAPILGPDSIGGDSFAKLFAQTEEERARPGFFTDNLYAASPILFDSANEATQAFARRFHARFAVEPSWSAVQGYDSARLAIAAARDAAAHAGPDLRARRAAVRGFLASLDGPARAIAGVSGPLWFMPSRGRDQPVRIGRFVNGLFESAPVQLVPVRSAEPADLASGAAIDLGDGHLVRRQVVVFTGVLLNEATQLDFKQSRFTADLYLWLRYAQTPGLAAAKPDDLEFPDLVQGSSGHPRPVRTAELPDGTHYVLWRLRGDFANEFDLRAFPADRQRLSVRFFNAHADSTRIVYVQDRRVGDVAAPDAFRNLPQWQKLAVATSRDTLVTHSGLGNPRLEGLEQVRELSGFSLNMVVRRRVLTTLMKNLLPLVLMTLIAYSTLHFPPHLLKEKVTVTVTAALAGAVLLSSINSQLGGVGYVLAVEYLFYVFFALCFFCILTFVLTERMRVLKHTARIARAELVSRSVYLGILSATVIMSVTFIALWSS
jgi:ABC-type branched-subunit amino acid transport system substrate-binding protein